MAKTKAKWNKDNVREFLMKDDHAVGRGLVILLGYQTADEQQSGNTTHDNGCGFNGTDAEFLTRLAMFYREHGFLTPGQLVHARKKILKYSGQLARHANAELERRNGQPANC
jgi:hypothetical protein